MTIRFDNSYARLPERFYARQMPAPAAEPRLIAVNDALARRMGIDPDWLRGPEGLAMLAGNAMPEGADPIAQAYAGHQFGGWVPQLGDGRAVLLGEVMTPEGERLDLQLKGAGQTPFSRRGDGRAWVGPVIREYLVSEAMAAMGVPTTRALAAVTTGEDILRDMRRRPGAVLARVAASHIRVGTFQFLAARGDEDGLRALSDHVVARHYPNAQSALDLLNAVVAAQAKLVAHWMSLGFIHGVMNTDNMAISGETIDYGPCAFMDDYHPDTVFSSIDQYGRYAYAAQPQVAAWNLAQFASALLPLMGPREAAIEAATEAVNGFIGVYQENWLARFRTKLGLATEAEGDLELIQDLLQRMAAEQADFTRVFAALRRAPDAARAEFADPAAFDTWADGWQARLACEEAPAAIMAHANPIRIPRNHQIEAAIEAAAEGDLAPFKALQGALADPFEDDPDLRTYEAAPLRDERVLRTFCGT